MTWAKLDDKLHAHPKASDAGLEAMGLWVLALSHSAAYPTNGHVQRSAALRLAGSADKLDELAGRLVAVGLWELHPDGGWQVHDYLEFNPSREEVLASRVSLSEKRAAAGRQGAMSRWQRDSKAMASAVLPSGKPIANDGPVPIPSRPDPHERERAPAAPLALTGSPTPSSTNGQSKPKPQKRTKTPVPPSDATTDEVNSWCAQWKIPTPAADAEVARFLDHWRSEDEVKADWLATWRNWVRRKPEFSRGSSNGFRGRTQPDDVGAVDYSQWKKRPEGAKAADAPRKPVAPTTQAAPRPNVVLAKAVGGAPPPAETPADVIEQRRHTQLAALAEMQAKEAPVANGKGRA